MSFDKQLQAMINDIDVPEELSPANIADMLRAVKPVQEKAEERNITVTSSKHTKKTNRAFIMRTLAAAAACVALAAGLWAVSSTGDTAPIEQLEIDDQIEYEAVQVQSYDELFNIYTGIYLKNSENPSDAGNGDGIEIKTDETAISGTETDTQTDTGSAPVITPAEKEVPEDTENVQSAIAADFSEADIIGSDEDHICYISGSTLYVVSKDGMTVTDQLDTENVPLEVYSRNGAVILLSAENVSISDTDSVLKNVCVDIYDISDGTLSPIRKYKQNGEYTSARMSDSGTLYLVTGYADYRTDPLDANSDIGSFVPGYYLDGDKKYVAPENITIPANANSTDYTVVSAIDCTENGDISVKAVLGSSVNAFCTEDALYIAGVGRRADTDYTIITSFALSENGLEYRASGSVAGLLMSRYSMNAQDGFFRIGCLTADDNGIVSSAVYVLDDTLTVVKSAGGLLSGTTPDSVKFDGKYASIYTGGSSEPALVIDLSSDSPVQADGGSSYFGAYVTKYAENRMVGISAVNDTDGKASALRLEMYDSDSGELVSKLTFAEYKSVSSPALNDKKALLCDPMSMVIGVPVSSVNEFGVKNQYYLYSYTDETGFVLIGTVEYNDIAEGNEFDRAVINDGVIYIMGGGRMVSASLSDMTIIGVSEFE